MIECIIKMNFWFIDRRTNFLSYLKCNIFFLRKENIEDQHLHQVTFITKLFITWKKCVNWSTFFGEILILIYVIIGNQENTGVKNKKQYVSSFMARTFILNNNKSHENIELGHVASSTGFVHWTQNDPFIIFTIYFDLKVIFPHDKMVKHFMV